MTFWDYATFNPFTGGIVAFIVVALVVLFQQLVLAFMGCLELCTTRVCNTIIRVSGRVEDVEEETEQ